MRRDLRLLLESDFEPPSGARAHDIARRYLAVSTRRRRLLLRVLARDFGPSVGAAHPIEPPRLTLLRRIAELPEGLRFLMMLRGDLIEAARADRSMKELEHELHRLLAAHFNVELLEVRRVTWNSPQAVLKKLIEHEAVHEIHGWKDLRNRLDEDRRCFALFHPRMPDEPLVFVEVALCTGLAGNIGELLDEQAPLGDPHAAKTAVFYSISNCHKGLAGTSLGHFLIVRAIDELRAELRGLETFVTLSPLPGFVSWLRMAMAREAPPVVRNEERERIARLLDPSSQPDSLPPLALMGSLLRLAAYYLLSVRRRDGKRAADAVAHFHLRNGARIERLNWLADRSARGLRQSFGMMVNYRYAPAELAANAEAYARDGSIAASPEIQAMAAEH